MKNKKKILLLSALLCAALLVPELIHAETVSNENIAFEQETTDQMQDASAAGENEENAPGDSEESSADDTDEPSVDGIEEEPEPEQKPEKVQKPKPVTNFTVKYQSKKSAAILRWTSENENVSYHVYRKKAGGTYKELAVVKKKKYEDAKAKADTQYIYRIVPENAAGKCGKAATVKLIPKPSVVEGLHTTILASNKVLLKWNQSTFAKKYLVYRKTDSGEYEQLGETKKTSYTDKNIVFGKKYRYKVIAVNANEERGTAGAISFAPKQAVNITHQKYSYSEMQADMKELATLYSDYCTWTSVGSSAQGRAIYDLAIGNPDAEKSLLVVCTLHAREYICSAVAMRQIESYLRSYHSKINGLKPADVLKNLQVHYIVMANPDGVTISQTKNSRWKSNANGVDLNRNFPASPFIKGGSKGSEGYSGEYALSEMESKAVADLTKKLKKEQKLVGVVNYHAMGQIIFGSCKSNALSKDTKTMYDIARRLTGYASAAGYKNTSPENGGQYRDYVMYGLGLPSITIEMGTTAAPCAFWEYDTAFRKNQAVVLTIANALK